jgi:hypothetical protein
LTSIFWNEECINILMISYNSRKLNLAKSKRAVVVLAIIFALTVLFGSPLHDHDLESSDVDLDCISCHLVHSNIGLKHDGPDIFSVIQKTQLVFIATTPSLIADKISVFSRGPPVIC